LASACAGTKDSGGAARDGGRAARSKALITDLHANLGQARYGAFAAATAELSAAVGRLCADPTGAPPDEAGVEAARAAWWAARGPWKQAELIRFGPTVEYPERLGPPIDTWPVEPGAVEALIAGDGPLDAAAFAAQGAGARGLPVIEHLLWADGPTAGARLGAEPRRCAALVGLSGDLQANAEALAAAWADPWGPRLTAPAPGDGDRYDDVQDVIDEWVNRMAFTVEELRGVKLGGPLGEGGGAAAQPALAESAASGRGAQDAADALAGVAAAWAGGEGLGVVDLVDDAALAARVQQRLDASAARLDALPAPLGQTVVEQPELVAQAQEALYALQVSLQVELAPAIGVTVTFNDNDGD
jgi:predicted lipoprotein